MHRPFGAGSRVVVRFTECADGDFDIDADGVAERRRAVDGRPCTWLDEQHGTDVVTVTEPGRHAGAVADAAVTAVPGAVLVAEMADCAPIALWSDAGAIGVVHAGWRGLEAGVLGNAVAALRGLGDAALNVEIGPSIRAGCYPFGPADLDRLADRFGSAVVAVTVGRSPGAGPPGRRSPGVRPPRRGAGPRLGAVHGVLAPAVELAGPPRHRPPCPVRGHRAGPPGDPGTEPGSPGDPATEPGP